MATIAELKRQMIKNSPAGQMSLMTSREKANALEDTLESDASKEVLKDIKNVLERSAFTTRTESKQMMKQLVHLEKIASSDLIKDPLEREQLETLITETKHGFAHSIKKFDLLSKSLYKMLPLVTGTLTYLVSDSPLLAGAVALGHSYLQDKAEAREEKEREESRERMTRLEELERMDSSVSSKKESVGEEQKKERVPYDTKRMEELFAIDEDEDTAVIESRESMQESAVQEMSAREKFLRARSLAFLEKARAVKEAKRLGVDLDSVWSADAQERFNSFKGVAVPGAEQKREEGMAVEAERDNEKAMLEKLEEIDENTEGKEKGKGGLFDRLLGGLGKFPGFLMKGLAGLGPMLLSGVVAAFKFIPMLLKKLFTGGGLFKALMKVFAPLVLIENLFGGFKSAFDSFAADGSIINALLIGIRDFGLGIIETLSFGLLSKENMTNILGEAGSAIGMFISDMFEYFTWDNIKAVLKKMFPNIASFIDMLTSTDVGELTEGTRLSEQAVLKDGASVEERQAFISNARGDFKKAFAAEEMDDEDLAEAYFEARDESQGGLTDIAKKDALAELIKERSGVDIKKVQSLDNFEDEAAKARKAAKEYKVPAQPLVMQSSINNINNNQSVSVLGKPVMTDYSFAQAQGRSTAVPVL